MNKVAFITGASRGIGKAVALKLAREGWDIVVAAKSIEEDPRLPGTIYSAAREIEQYGTRVLPVQCNVIRDDSIRGAVEKTLAEFEKIDAVINNAGALWWTRIEDTPLKRFDLVMNVNVRGAFAVTQAFLPTMIEQRSGHVIMMSPPVDTTRLQGATAYLISKFGMTLTALGLAKEYQGQGIHATALWPTTVIESYATLNYGLGNPKTWRKADILGDAVHEILLRPQLSNGRALHDEPFLRECGYTDFEQYLCEPDGEPMPLTLESAALGKVSMTTKWAR